MIGISADADAGGDADAERLHLRAGLVAQRARARDDADVAANVDVARHDAEHGLAGADDAGAVRPDDRGALVLRIAAQIALDAHHVLRGYAVGDDAHQPQSRIGRLHQRIRRIGRRHEREARLGAGGPHRILHGVEHRPVEMRLAALARRHAAHHPGAVGDHFLGVKGRLVAGEALHDHAAWSRRSGCSSRLPPPRELPRRPLRPPPPACRPR